MFTKSILSPRWILHSVPQLISGEIKITYCITRAEIVGHFSVQFMDWYFKSTIGVFYAFILYVVGLEYSGINFNRKYLKWSCRVCRGCSLNTSLLVIHQNVPLPHFLWRYTWVKCPRALITVLSLVSIQTCSSRKANSSSILVHTANSW